MYLDPVYIIEPFIIVVHIIQLHMARSPDGSWLGSVLIGLDDLQDVLHFVWADGRDMTSQEVGELFHWAPSSDIGKHVVFVNKFSLLNRGRSDVELFYACEVVLVDGESL